MTSQCRVQLQAKVRELQGLMGHWHGLATDLMLDISSDVDVKAPLWC